MKIVIPGGSGQVGTILARHFHARGDEVVVLSRTPSKSAWRTVKWDGETLDRWVDELEDSHVVINLAGRIVNCRYHARNRCDIWSSRARSVRVLGHAIAQLGTPPPLWLQASTATIYSHRFDSANDDQGDIGGLENGVPETWRFSIDVARAWEGEFALCDTPRTRKVALRAAPIMSPDDGGIFDYLHWLVRIGLGGSIGSGQQYVSWIHASDFVRAIDFIIDNDSLAGTVNLAAPNPLPNQEFMALLRAAARRRFALPTPEWMLELGAIFLRTESELVLKSRRVTPSRLLHCGFHFNFPSWEDASLDLCAGRRS